MKHLALLALPAALFAAPAVAQDAATLGSTAFCPFALPPENGTQRSINLGIVQYIDVRADEVKIAFGGGNLGSGHEARIPVKSRDEADAVLARLRQTAARCAQSTSGGKP
jgi:hypothetical protein